MVGLPGSQLDAVGGTGKPPLRLGGRRQPQALFPPQAPQLLVVDHPLLGRVRLFDYSVL